MLLRAGVGSFENARFVHWPGTPDEIVDEYTLVLAWDGAPAGAPLRLRVVRRHRDFFSHQCGAGR